MNNLSDLISHLGDLISHWFGSWGFWWKRTDIHFGIHYRNLLFFLACAYIIAVVSASSVAKQATSMLVKCLAHHSGHVEEEGV